MQRKSEKLFEDSSDVLIFTGLIFGLVAIVSALLVLAYWCYILFLYLENGFLPDRLSVFILNQLHVSQNSWLIQPSNWFGLQKILMFSIGFGGPGLPTFVFSTLLFIFFTLLGASEAKAAFRAATDKETV